MSSSAIVRTEPPSPRLLSIDKLLSPRGFRTVITWLFIVRRLLDNRHLHLIMKVRYERDKKQQKKQIAFRVPVFFSFQDIYNMQ